MKWLNANQLLLTPITRGAAGPILARWRCLGSKTYERMRIGPGSKTVNTRSRWSAVRVAGTRGAGLLIHDGARAKRLEDGGGRAISAACDGRLTKRLIQSRFRSTTFLAMAFNRGTGHMDGCTDATPSLGFLDVSGVSMSQGEQSCQRSRYSRRMNPITG